jgi:hypothetical protein
VDDTLRRGSIQFADGFEHSSLGLFTGTTFDRCAGLGDERAGAAAEDTVLDAALLVLPVSFYLGLDVSQSTSSKNIRQSQGWILPEGGIFVKVSKKLSLRNANGKIQASCLGLETIICLFYRGQVEKSWTGNF